jgi:hypothetical protein
MRGQQNKIQCHSFLHLFRLQFCVCASQYNTPWLADMYILTLFMDNENQDYSIHSTSQKVDLRVTLLQLFLSTSHRDETFCVQYRSQGIVHTTWCWSCAICCYLEGSYGRASIFVLQVHTNRKKLDQYNDYINCSNSRLMVIRTICSSWSCYALLQFTLTALTIFNNIMNHPKCVYKELKFQFFQSKHNFIL